MLRNGVDNETRENQERKVETRDGLPDDFIRRKVRARKNADTDSRRKIFNKRHKIFDFHCARNGDARVGGRRGKENKWETIMGEMGRRYDGEHRKCPIYDRLEREKLSFENNKGK